MIGMPEARIILAEAALAVATAPKSNASYNAINAALADVDAGLIGQVPLHLRNAPTALMKSWGNHEATGRRARLAGRVAPQQYMPDELQGREYYHRTTAVTSMRSSRDWSGFGRFCTKRTITVTAVPASATPDVHFLQALGQGFR